MLIRVLKARIADFSNIRITCIHRQKLITPVNCLMTHRKLQKNGDKAKYSAFESTLFSSIVSYRIMPLQYVAEMSTAAENYTTS